MTKKKPLMAEDLEKALEKADFQIPKNVKYLKGGERIIEED